MTNALIILIFYTSPSSNPTKNHFIIYGSSCTTGSKRTLVPVSQCSAISNESSFKLHFLKCVCVCADTNAHEGWGQPRSHPQEHHLSPFTQCLCLAWSSPIRLAGQASTASPPHMQPHTALEGSSDLTRVLCQKSKRFTDQAITQPLTDEGLGMSSKVQYTLPSTWGPGFNP